MNATRPLLLLLLLTLGGAAGCAAPAGQAEARASAQLPTIAEFTAKLAARPGFVDTWWDAAQAKVYLAPRPDDEELLYVVSLPAGLGSNDVGLDRAQIGARSVVLFRRVGPKVLLVAPNLAWTSSAESAVERRAVADSFAESVLFAFDVVAEEDGRAVVDATPFVVRDAHGIALKLKRTEQGAFAVDRDRSAPLLERSQGFPDNTELEALLTFASDEPGRQVRATAADPSAVSLRVRHSLVRLPDLATSPFRPRVADPRAGFFTAAHVDATGPIDAPRTVEYVARHDLRPGGPPIVYYVDRAAPEPVRTALLEGARFWEPVFAAAGFPGGFKAELLPADADPQDVRFNVVTWVHRATRGWSYGDAVADPRTGQILKGHVSLGALRVRQDVLIAEGLLAPYASEDRDERVLATALARIRQLAAHEVGHTLGLQHNFAASSVDRASVMDYPPPRVLLTDDGGIDLSQAYAPSAGAWDELAIRFGYGWCAPADEEAFRASALAAIEASGIPFLTDADARGNDRAHPLANLWDDGADPVAGLVHECAVRAAALSGFGAAAIQRGEPASELEAALVPLYFHHRYQLEAAIRQLGGVSYRHAVRGGAPADVTPVAADVQRGALAAVLATFEPDFLALAPGILALIPPPAPGGDPATERFDDRAYLLDPEGIAAAAIEMTLELLLDPTRAARMIDQNVRDPEMPGFDAVLEPLIALGWLAADDRGELRAQVLERLMDLAVDERTALRVQRVAWKALDEVRRMHAEGIVHLATIEERRQALWERVRLDAFFDDPRAPRPTRALPPIPPGSPIGCGIAPGAGGSPWDSGGSALDG